MEQLTDEQLLQLNIDLMLYHLKYQYPSNIFDIKVESGDGSRWNCGFYLFGKRIASMIFGVKQHVIKSELDSWFDNNLILREMVMI